MISIESNAQDKQFEFGDNWRRFHRVLNNDRIDDAKKSLKKNIRGQ